MAAVSIPNFVQQSDRNAPGMKCRGLRAGSMNLHYQPSHNASLIRRCAAPSPGGRGVYAPPFFAWRFLFGYVAYRQSLCNYNCATVSAYISEGVRTSGSKKYAPLHLELRVRTFRGRLYALAILRRWQICLTRGARNVAEGAADRRRFLFRSLALCRGERPASAGPCVARATRVEESRVEQARREMKMLT
jgi:hypothetical protein